MSQVQGSEKIHSDLLEPWKIIRHFRDLNNLANLLDHDTEVQKFVKRLGEVGWSKDYIHQFQSLGACGTRFDKLVPHVLPESGDRIEYHKSKSRFK